MVEFTITISSKNLARANTAAQAVHDITLKQFVKDRVKELVLDYEGNRDAEIAKQAIVIEKDFIEIV